MNIFPFLHQDALIDAALVSIYQAQEICVYSHANSKRFTLTIPKNVQVIADRAYIKHYQDKSA